jgi:hypothetical protein
MEEDSTNSNSQLHTFMNQTTRIVTGNKAFDSFYPIIRGFLEKDTMDLVIDSVPVKGYRSPDTPAIWLRDHSDMMRGFRYHETDMQSAISHFAETQARNGRIFDYFTNHPEKVPCERENWFKYVRVPVEADVEYRFVKGAYLAWQTTGDDAWIQDLVPAMERALAYAFGHPWRWDPTHQLVKRAYTIDSWDFAYAQGFHDWLQFQIDANTHWGIMHGDNSGFYEACRMLAQIQRYLGDDNRASHWDSFADGLRERLNKVAWNGQFYTHFVKLTPVTIPGVDEASQLSFSNAMNINRGVTNHEQAVAILQEYRKRREQTGAFAEWFSIHPAFPDGIFGDEKIVAGAYCNGGIMPLVGGELARAYLENGFEKEGVETLLQYHELVSKRNETFLWYFPDGSPSSIETSTSPDAMPTDGWGSSAMLYGFMEGLVGIQDRGRLMDRVRLCPRWAAAGITSAEVEVAYAASQTALTYAYASDQSGIQLSVSANADIELHLLLPEGLVATSLKGPDGDLPFTTSTLRNSTYLDSHISVKGRTSLHVDLVDGHSA